MVPSPSYHPIIWMVPSLFAIHGLSRLWLIELSIIRWCLLHPIILSSEWCHPCSPSFLLDQGLCTNSMYWYNAPSAALSSIFVCHPCSSSSNQDASVCTIILVLHQCTACTTILPLDPYMYYLDCGSSSYLSSDFDSCDSCDTQSWPNRCCNGGGNYLLDNISMGTHRCYHQTSTHIAKQKRDRHCSRLVSY